MVSAHHISLFRSVFKGRDDAFAIRWQRGNKSGYVPAYIFDPELLKLHKRNGGTFQNYPNKQLQRLKDKDIREHLEGHKHIGVYPLLADNTSWFIAADFDGSKADNELPEVMQLCDKYDLPVYIERSQSGKGVHVWMFFEQPYPAYQSRSIFTHILKQAGVKSDFDKNSGFDRLFPSQNTHTGKGLGSLIALPLQKNAMEKGTCCFLKTTTFEPYSDQWESLSNIRRASVDHLNKVLGRLEGKSESVGSTIQIEEVSSLRIVLERKLLISRKGMSGELADYLKNELQFLSSEYLIKQKVGKNPWPSRPYYNLIEEDEEYLIVPKGTIGRVIRFCRNNKIEYEFIDKREHHTPLQFDFKAVIRPHQEPAVEAARSKDMGIITASPGSGKTVIALKIIQEKQQPALIIVHRKQLVEQWIERIEMFLGLPQKKIGVIGAGKRRNGEKVTVAMIQSLSRMIETDEAEKLQDAFGMIIVDECHRLPAQTFRKTITRLNSYYLYGLTATPFRKYNDDKLIFIHLGEFISEIESPGRQKIPELKVIIRNTELDIPFNPRTDKFETISKVLVHDSLRNELIIADVQKELDQQKRVIILTERRDHVEILQQYLKQSYEVIALSGENTDKEKKSGWNQLKRGEYEVFITTGQYFGEGMDLDNASCLFLVYPFSFKGKLIQYIGRVQRGEDVPLIYDYRDIHIPYLNQLFLKRNAWYKKLNRQTGLFDEEHEPQVLEARGIQKIDKKIFLSWEELRFQYGSIAFEYRLTDDAGPVTFVFEHDDIRPEFDLLKPYFAKQLRKNKIRIHIQAEFKDGGLVSGDASSDDLERINSGLVERVKSQYVERAIIGNSGQDGAGHTGQNMEQIGKGMTAMYDSAGELLDEIGKIRNVKHYRSLQYLARYHDETKLNVRFVTRPFAFLLLITGRYKDHVIMETLDTEEATYIWSIPHSPDALQDELKKIEHYLHIIKHEGRQAYLKSAPANFRRVWHDYSNERKGFVLWRDALEEVLE